MKIRDAEVGRDLKKNLWKCQFKLKDANTIFCYKNPVNDHQYRSSDGFENVRNPKKSNISLSLPFSAKKRKINKILQDEK